jgi:hypothetical protein
MRLAFRAVDISLIKLYFLQKDLIYCPVFYEHKGLYLFFVSNFMPFFINIVYTSTFFRPTEIHIIVLQEVYLRALLYDIDIYECFSIIL